MYVLVSGLHVCMCTMWMPLHVKASARPVSSENRFCIRAESSVGEGLSLFLYSLFSLCFLLGYHVKFQVVLTAPQWTWKQRLLFFNHFVLFKFNPNNVTHKIRVYDRSPTMKAKISFTYSSLEELRTISLLMREGWEQKCTSSVTIFRRKRDSKEKKGCGLWSPAILPQLTVLFPVLYLKRRGLFYYIIFLAWGCDSVLA